MNPKYINDYLKKFDLNPADVGLYIAEGGQHYVFHYQHDQVIKIPKRSILMRLYGLYKVENLRYSDTVLNEVFPSYFLDTEVIPSRNHRHYVIIQKYLENGQPITLKNFHLIKSEFLKIAQLNQQLIKTHKLTLDFISFHGFFVTLKASIFKRKHQAIMENLMAVEHNGEYFVKIIDSNLIETSPKLLKRFNLIHWLVDLLFYHGSRFLIKDNFGVKI